MNDIATYALTVDAPIAGSLLSLIRSRFDRVSQPDGRVLVVDDLDQASVRALLTLLWDAGHDVVALTSTRSDPPGHQRRPD